MEAFYRIPDVSFHFVISGLTFINNVADPVHFFGSGFGSGDPIFKILIGSGGLKKTGYGSYLNMFWMFSKINIFLWHYYTKSKHLLALKIKEKETF